MRVSELHNIGRVGLPLHMIRRQVKLVATVAGLHSVAVDERGFIDSRST